jgi:hypothetical protein
VVQTGEFGQGADSISILKALYRRYLESNGIDVDALEIVPPRIDSGSRRFPCMPLALARWARELAHAYMHRGALVHSYILDLDADWIAGWVLGLAGVCPRDFLRALAELGESATHPSPRYRAARVALADLGRRCSLCARFALDPTRVSHV